MTVSCDAIKLTKICAQEKKDRQITPGKTLKIASSVIPATKGVSGVTICEDDRQTQRVKTFPASAVLACNQLSSVAFESSVELTIFT